MTISNTKQALDVKLAFKKFFESIGTTVIEDGDRMYTSGNRINEQCEFKKYYLCLYETRDDCLRASIYSYIDDISTEKFVEMCVELAKYIEEHPVIEANARLCSDFVYLSVLTHIELFSKTPAIINEEILEKYIKMTIINTENVELALKDFICK